MKYDIEIIKAAIERINHVNTRDKDDQWNIQTDLMESAYIDGDFGQNVKTLIEHYIDRDNAEGMFGADFDQELKRQLCFDNESEAA